MAKKDKGTITGEPVTYQIPAPAGGVQMETFIPWTLVKRGVRRRVITPIDSPEQFMNEAVAQQSHRKVMHDTPLIRALGLAHHWQALLDAGQYSSLTEIASIEDIDRGRVSRIAQLLRLSPEAVEACMNNNAKGLALEQLIRVAIPSDWEDQQILFRGSQK
jgi:hypothetical protein